MTVTISLLLKLATLFLNLFKSHHGNFLHFKIISQAFSGFPLCYICTRHEFCCLFAQVRKSLSISTAYWSSKGLKSNIFSGNVADASTETCSAVRLVVQKTGNAAVVWSHLFCLTVKLIVVMTCFVLYFFILTKRILEKKNNETNTCQGISFFVFFSDFTDNTSPRHCLY